MPALLTRLDPTHSRYLRDMGKSWLRKIQKHSTGLWAEKTGVPDVVVIHTYMFRYRNRPGALAPGSPLENDQHEKEIFKSLLPHEYAKAPLRELGRQLIYLRKCKWANLNLSGRPGPRRGFKERAAALAVEGALRCGCGVPTAEAIGKYVREKLKGQA